jgi:WD40 repeat protein
LQTGKQKGVLLGATDAVVAVAFAPDGHLLTRSLDGTVSFWDTNTGFSENFNSADSVESVAVMGSEFTRDSPRRSGSAG